MPVPLPTTEVNLHPPDHDEVVITARACVSALRGDGQLQDLQRYILCAHIESMCGVHLEVDSLEHIGPEEFADQKSQTANFQEARVPVLESPTEALTDTGMMLVSISAAQYCV